MNNQGSAFNTNTSLGCRICVEYPPRGSVPNPISYPAPNPATIRTNGGQNFVQNYFGRYRNK